MYGNPPSCLRYLSCSWSVDNSWCKKCAQPRPTRHPCASSSASFSSWPWLHIPETLGMLKNHTEAQAMKGLDSKSLGPNHPIETRKRHTFPRSLLANRTTFGGIRGKTSHHIPNFHQKNEEKHDQNRKRMACLSCKKDAKVVPYFGVWPCFFSKKTIQLDILVMKLSTWTSHIHFNCLL